MNILVTKEVGVRGQQHEAYHKYGFCLFSIFELIWIIIFCSDMGDNEYFLLTPVLKDEDLAF